VLRGEIEEWLLWCCGIVESWGWCLGGDDVVGAKWGGFGGAWR
jgi:hypothetical protein